MREPTAPGGAFSQGFPRALRLAALGRLSHAPAKQAASCQRAVAGWRPGRGAEPFAVCSRRRRLTVGRLTPRNTLGEAFNETGFETSHILSRS